METCPLTDIEHSVEAILPDARELAMLGITAGEPACWCCVVLVVQESGDFCPAGASGRALQAALAKPGEEISQAPSVTAGGAGQS
jgi:hypothetical protein